MRRVLLLMILVVGFAGCGASSPKTIGPASTMTVAPASTKGETAGLRQAVEGYSAAYLGDQPVMAYALLSARCRAQITMPQMTSLTHGAKLLYGSAKLIGYNEDEVVGDSARVTYSYDQPTINQSGQRWTREAGKWHWDGC